MAEFLIFMVAGKFFGIPVSVAAHVVRMVEITRISSDTQAVAGIINYHGSIIPVFSLRSRFILPEKPLDPADLLIITSGAGRMAAMIAEQVVGVKTIEDDLIESDAVLPGMTGIQGVVKTPDGMILITDPDRFLLPDEERALSVALIQEEGKT
ncbi:chemotaxis protein CheW [Methanospirillum lacunae]|nr:chemotaxis protein CheW [Methanospirillum lacunae]